MSKPDKSYVEELKLGNEDILHKLYDQYSDTLLAYAKHTIRNPLLAEDFVQDAYCTLWENRTKLNSEQPVQSYLYKVVHSRCVDYIRKQVARQNYTQNTEWRLRELELTQNPFDSIFVSEIMAQEANEILQNSLQNLPEQTREIFLLSRNQQLKNSEIAERNGVTVKAIEYHISKALQQLKTALKDFL